jgi:predicted acyl esterase
MCIRKINFVVCQEANGALQQSAPKALLPSYLTKVSPTTTETAVATATSCPTTSSASGGSGKWSPINTAAPSVPSPVGVKTQSKVTSMLPSLAQNCRDQNADNAANPFLDDEYHASKVFRLEDIEVPVLSVANWGGNTLHLRGNMEGYTWAGSKHKFLRFIVGRHDLPFYYDEEVEVHRSFLEALLKDNDYADWKTGKVPPVSVCLRKGDVGFNNPEGEKTFPRRDKLERPIARTEYTKFFLTPGLGLKKDAQGMEHAGPSILSYDAGDSMVKGVRVLEFKMPPVQSELEVTGRVLAHLVVSVDSSVSLPPENLDLDLFLTLRHFTAAGKEVPYTSSSGDAVPVTKGWLRTSLRQVNTESPYHRPYLPRREYLSTDVQQV